MTKITVLFLLILVSCGKQVSKKTQAGAGPAEINKTTQVNKNLPIGSGVSEKFQITPNGQHIVYISDEDTQGINELYVANIDGTNRKKISNPLDNGENVIDFKISDDSLKVAYTADYTLSLKNLHTVNIDGTEYYQVNQGMDSAIKSIGHFEWVKASVSNKLVYTSDEDKAQGNYTLYVANYDGTARISLQTNVVSAFFRLTSNPSSPSSTKVVYRQGASNLVLKSIQITGIGDSTINSAFDLVGNPASSVSSFLLSPDSSKVVYRSNQEGNQFGLYVANINSPHNPQKISGTLVSGGQVLLSAGSAFAFSSDSSKVAFIADKDTDNKEELYITELSNPTVQTKLSGTSLSSSDVSAFKFAGDKVLFLSDKDVDGVNELFIVNQNGTNLTKVNDDLVLGENVGYFYTDSSSVIYATDKTNPGTYEVFKNNLDLSAEEKILESSSGIGGYDPASSHAAQAIINNGRVYMRANINNTNNNLYVFNNSLIKIQNTENVILANSSLGASFLVTPLDTYVVYRKEVNGQNNLFSTKLD